MWDARYATDDYVFGTEPAMFLTAHEGLVLPGARALCVAEGEGRNAVWLARRGCAVTAFDTSTVGLAKARRLAEAHGVTLELHDVGVEDWDWDRPFDLVVAIFVQFAPPPLRARMFDGMRRALAPGGRLMVHGYTPKQVTYRTGGPPQAEHMYDIPLLRGAFGDLRILRLAEYEADLAEGAGHAGRSALIDLIADRPL